MTMILVMLLSSMSAFRVFGEIYMLSGGSGGVGGADLTMTMLIKQEGTGINARTGYSGALGMVMFVRHLLSFAGRIRTGQIVCPACRTVC